MKVICSSCNKKLKVPDSLAGQTFNCPACKASVVAEQSLDIAPGPEVKPKKTKRKTEDEGMPDHPLTTVPGKASQAVCPSCGERIQRRDILCRSCGASLDDVGDRGGYKAGFLKTLAAKTNWIYSVFVLGLIGVGGYFIYIKVIAPAAKVIREDGTLAPYTGGAQRAAKNLNKKINEAHKLPEDKGKSDFEKIIDLVKTGKNQNVHNASRILRNTDEKNLKEFVTYVMAQKNLESLKKLMELMAISQNDYVLKSLCESLYSDNLIIRRAAFVGIKKLKKSEIVKQINKVLVSKNEKSIGQALSLIISLKLKEVVSDVAKLLASPNPSLQIDAAKALIKIRLSDSAIPQAMATFKTGSIDVSRVVAGALASNPKGIAALKAELESTNVDPSNPNDILHFMALGRGILQSSDEKSKHLLAEKACAHMPKPDYIKMAKRILGSKRGSDRLVQVANLYEKGLIISPFDNILMICLADSNPAVRQIAFDIFTLRPNILTPEVLMFVIDDDDFSVALSAVRYLRHISKTNDQYKDCVSQMLKGHSKQKRIFAAGILALDAQDEGRQLLEDVVTTEIVASVELRGWAALCLSKLGTEIKAETIFKEASWKRPNCGNAFLFAAAEKLGHEEASKILKDYLKKRNILPDVKVAIMSARLLLGEKGVREELVALAGAKKDAIAIMATRALLGELPPGDVITVIGYLGRLASKQRPSVLSTVRSVGSEAEEYLQIMLPAADVSLSQSIIIAMSAFGQKASSLSKQMVLAKLTDSSLGAVARSAFYKMTRVKGAFDWPISRWAAQAGLPKPEDPPNTVNKFFGGLCMNMPSSWEPSATGINTGMQEDKLSVKMEIKNYSVGSVDAKLLTPSARLAAFLESNQFAKIQGKSIISSDGYRVFSAPRLSSYGLKSLGVRVFNCAEKTTTLYVFVTGQSKSQIITANIAFKADGLDYANYRYLVEKDMLKSLSIANTVRRVSAQSGGPSSSARFLRAQWIEIKMPDGWTTSSGFTARAKGATGSPSVRVYLEMDPRHDGANTPPSKRKYKSVSKWRQAYSKELSYRLVGKVFVPRKGITTAMMNFMTFSPASAASFSLSDRNTGKYHYYYLVMHRTANKDYYGTIEFMCDLKEKSKYISVFGKTFKNLISTKTQGYN